MAPIEIPSIDPRLQVLVDQLPTRVIPLDVIQTLAEAWRADTSLHQGLDEPALFSQVVAVLRHAGIDVVTEPRSWKGHADLVVEVDRRGSPRHFVLEGRGLVANTLLWAEPAAFREALDRLVPQLGKLDRQAAIIIFVRKGGLSQVMQQAKYVCEKHPAFGNFGKAFADNQMKLWLSISKNPDKVIPTILLFCDLFEGATRGGMNDHDSEPEPWVPLYEDGLH